MISVSKELEPDTKKLSQDYKKALQNQVFANFIEKLKIEKDTAQKYTSALEDSCTEYQNCQTCKGLMECQNKMTGYAYLPRRENGAIHFVYKPCKYKKDQEDMTKHLKNVQYFDVSHSMKNADFTNVDNRYKGRQETISWIRKFVDDYPNVTKGLYLHGNFGCGKTYLICALFNELAKVNVKSAIVFFPEFLRNLKTSFDTDYADKMEYIKKVPLLLIDDLGAETLTPWARDEILCPILQYRMEAKLPTFITSNFDIISLEQHLSITKDGIEQVKARRIIERIKQVTEDLEMKSINMRK